MLQAAAKVPSKPTGMCGGNLLKNLIIGGLISSFGIVGLLVGMHLSGALSPSQVCLSVCLSVRLSAYLVSAGVSVCLLSVCRRVCLPT